MCAMISLFSAPYFSARPAKFKSLFWSAKCLFKKISNRLREKYANEEKEQNSDADIPKFPVGILEFLCRTSKKLSKKVLFTERFISLPYGNPWFAFKNRDPGSSVCDVRHDWCFSLVMIVGWLSLFPQKKRGDYIFPPYMADVFLCGKCLPGWFFQTSGDVWTLGKCAFIELWSGILNLEYWHWKNASNCKWCIPLKREIRRHTTLCDL